MLKKGELVMAGVCGKDCRGCEDRQRYRCRGCLETGGNPVWGSCRVAACCHSQGMQNCGECASRERCAKLEDMERIRQQWKQEEQARQNDWRAGLARRTPVMAQWLPVLFWLSLASTVLNLMDQLPLSQGVSLALSAVNLCLGIGTLVAYWKLAPLSDRLRLVWRVQLAAQIVGAAIAAMLPAIFRPASDMDGLVLAGGLGVAGALAVVVMGLVAMYQFCEAMAEELEASIFPVPPGGAFQGEFRPVPRQLANDWRLLRRCVFWSLGIMLGVLLLALLLQGGMGILLLLVVLAAALVLAGCGIAQLVLLWKSGRFFRELPPAREPLPPAEDVP